MLFNVLKNGCRVEELHTDIVESIGRALAIYWSRLGVSPIDAHGAHLL